MSESNLSSTRVIETQPSNPSRIPTGIPSALAAYLIWGFVPVYFKLLSHIPAVEIIAHRIVWSLLLVFALLLATRKLNLFWAVLKNRKTRYWLALTSVIVISNWLVFIWAIGDGRVLESSLGYYINPLVSILLGMIFLKEQLNKWQTVAVAMAGFAIIILVVMVGSLPWVSLYLATSFGFYGLIRKKLMVDSTVGLAAETGYLVPAALGYLIFLVVTGDANTDGSIVKHDWPTLLLLMGTGLATSVPLLFFAMAATHLKLMTLGMLQYMAPSIHFVLAVFVYNEAFSSGHMIAFGFIWLGLIIYTWDSYRQRKKNA